MQIVHTDLDNTLIYSYKHEIGGPKTVWKSIREEKSLS